MSWNIYREKGNVMKQKKKNLWRAVLAISLAVLVCVLGYIVWYLYRDYEAEKKYEALQSMARETAEAETTTEAETDPEGKDGEAAELPDGIFQDLENPIDFKKLSEVNPEIYAWIRIPDTNIDYPIVQREGDDAYYLTHDIYGEERVAASIYTEDCNQKDFSDPNTVIYGHNMKNKSMFQNLHLFEDPDFFASNRYVYIYTPERSLVYEIFASYTYDDRHIMHSFDFTDREVYAQYLSDIFHVRSMDKNIREGVEVTADDKIITLETCVGTGEKYRYVVQAVLLGEKES